MSNSHSAVAHEAQLLTEAIEALSLVPGVRLIGTAADRVGVLSFVLENAHPHDIGTILDLHGVAAGRASLRAAGDRPLQCTGAGVVRPL